MINIQQFKYGYLKFYLIQKHAAHTCIGKLQQLKYWKIWYLFNISYHGEFSEDIMIGYTELQ